MRGICRYSLCGANDLVAFLGFIIMSTEILTNLN